jgi:hypothetical protein
MEPVYNKASIKSALTAVFKETAQAVHDMKEADFLAPKAPKWSAADIFDHMIRSAKPVSSGLKMPKIVFKNFGTPNRPSRTYEELVKRYKERLAAGGQASGPYVPEKGTSYDKAAMLKKWDEIGEKMTRRVEKNWADEKLDKYLVPHPLLGKLTIREILFFTIYHTGHHLEQIRHGQ